MPRAPKARNPRKGRGKKPAKKWYIPGFRV